MESDVKASCNRFLKKIPKSKFVPYSPYPYGEPGTPDKIGCINGQMILIEFKDKGKEPSALQKIRIKEWQAAGAKVYVIDSLKKLKQEDLNVQRD